ncbi:MAG TPA: class I SAM-dependent methyltransferase [Candidatus Omnitrophota bacterium]|nr:class I SAM-dependent methyltransferase [Candidatus Omnitrophota bacterium]HPN57430.1 class I SAM-dependent methyltransferase [Candidatus Omnitrophota bacterium]
MSKQCPLCHAENIKESFEKNLIFYYRCPSCRFLFSGQDQNPNLENTAIEHYEPAYVRYLEDSPEDEINFSKTLAWIEQFKPLNGLRVLDVGTGTGKFVRYLRRNSVDAFGLEPSVALFNRYLAREPFFFLTDLQGLPSATSPELKYDAVIISDVIEHVRDPHPFFSGLDRVLKPGAVVYICTPNAGSSLARLCGKNWHYINKYHFSFFSRETLQGITAQYGLKELGFTHCARFRSIGYIFQYFADFVAGDSKFRIPASWYQRGLPLNLHDLMQVIYQHA